MTLPVLAKRLAPLGLMIAVILAFFLLGLNRYVTLDTLRANEQWLRTFTNTHLLVAMSGFVLAYIAVVAFSVPVATVMTITGGVLFGVWRGAVLSVVGATTGAIILFVLTRYVVRDAFRTRSGPFINRMTQGFERNAFSYLLLLRLVPLVPFSVVNLVTPTLGVSLRSFTLATVIGIVPGTLAFASIGDGLSIAAGAGSHDTSGQAASPQMIAVRVGLALLALVPFIVQWLRRRRAR